MNVTYSEIHFKASKNDWNCSQTGLSTNLKFTQIKLSFEIAFSQKLGEHKFIIYMYFISDAIEACVTDM